MRRADRLIQIMQLIRGRRLTTAALLAQRLEVSERTIYRDVATCNIRVYRSKAKPASDIAWGRASNCHR